MAVGRVLLRLGCGLTVLGALYALQRPFRQFNGVEYSIGDIPMPPDWQEKMHRIEKCTECRSCADKCPYGLDTPSLLKAMLKDYEEFVAAHE